MNDKEHIDSSSAERAGIGALLKQLSEQLIGLLRAELSLAKAEVAAQAKTLAAGVGLIVAAGLLALNCLAFLLLTITALLATTMAWWQAAALVTGGVALLAAALGMLGVRRLKRAQPPTPKRAIASVKQDVSIIKEGLRP